MHKRSTIPVARALPQCFSGPLSRAAFLKGAGAAAAGAGLTMMSSGGVVRAVLAGQEWDVYPPASNLTTAVANALPGDTIRIHAGPYDLGSGFLNITKSLNLIGVDGKPEIKSSNSSRVVLIKAPNGSVELNNLSIKGALSLAGNPPARLIDDQGSSSFILRGCDVVCQEVYGKACIGLNFGGISLADKSVTGEIIIKDSFIKPVQAGMFVGWMGPVYELSKIEITHCKFELWGGIIYPVNKGNWVIGVSHYPSSVLFGTLPQMEGTRPDTHTVVSNNAVAGGYAIWTQGLKGSQVIEDNIVIAAGMIKWASMHLVAGIGVSTYEEDTDCSVIVSNNQVIMDISPGYPDAVTSAIMLGSSFFVKHRADFLNGAVTGNTVMTTAGSAPVQFGLLLDAKCQDNVLRNNDLSAVQASSAQACVRSLSNGNYFGPDHNSRIPSNAFGPITSEALAGIVDYGFNNSFVMNDFTESGIKGLEHSNQPCVYLASTAHDAFVLQSGTFPAGTGDAKEQVVDMMKELTGQTTNRVIGHPASFLAESIRPGIGQHLHAIEAKLQESQQFVLTAEDEPAMAPQEDSETY